MGACRPGTAPFTPSDIAVSHLATLVLLVALKVTLESIKCADIWSEERHLGIFSKKGKSHYLTCLLLTHAQKLSIEDNNGSVCAYFMAKEKKVDRKDQQQRLKTAWSRSNCLLRQPHSYAAGFGEY